MGVKPWMNMESMVKSDLSLLNFDDSKGKIGSPHRGTPEMAEHVHRIHLISCFYLVDYLLLGTQPLKRTTV